MNIPTIRVVFDNGLGDITDITKTLSSPAIDDIFYAIREALAGCGFAKENIDYWFSEEES